MRSRAVNLWRRVFWFSAGVFWIVLLPPALWFNDLDLIERLALCILSIGLGVSMVWCGIGEI